MSGNTTDQADDGMEEHGQEGRYAAMEIEGETIVIYDQQQHTAWIQSNDAVTLDAAT